MGAKTGIAWTDATWSPWRGCTKVSEGCDHCYMYREQKRYGMEPSEVVRASKRTFNLPKRLKPGTKVFVCSWSDFFHQVADHWRQEAWDLIRARPDLTFQLCTKRPGRMQIGGVLPDDWGDGWPNVWLGVTVENHLRSNRVHMLFQTPAALYFASVEPMLTPIDFSPVDLARLDWVIVGGESGPDARPMFECWAEDLLDQCYNAGVAFFMKQLGGWPDKRDKMADFPDSLRVREFPRG